MSSPSISNNTAASVAGSSSSNNAAKEKEKENNADDTFDQVMLCIVFAPSVHSQLYFQFDEEESDLQFGATASGRKRLFSKELRCMMFGFGDDQNPYTESVDLLEDLVIEYITEMASTYFVC